MKAEKLDKKFYSGEDVLDHFDLTKGRRVNQDLNEKKQSKCGAAKSILKHIHGDPSMTDEDSLQYSLLNGLKLDDNNERNQNR